MHESPHGLLFGPQYLQQIFGDVDGALGLGVAGVIVGRSVAVGFLVWVGIAVMVGDGVRVGVSVEVFGIQIVSAMVSISSGL